MQRLTKIILFLLLTLFTVTVVADDSTDDEGSDAPLKHEQLQSIFADIDLGSDIQYQEKNSVRMMAKTVAPVLYSDEYNDSIENFDDQISNLVDEEVNRFITELKRHPVDYSALAKEARKNELYVDYDTATIFPKKNPVISVRFNIQEIKAGMAHPYHYHRTFTYDITQGRELKLADLFAKDADYLSFFTEYCAGFLNKKFARNEQLRTMIIKGTAPKPENYKNWNLLPDGILITFDSAQTLPSVYGAQTVVIPYAVLKPFMNPDSPIAFCIDHPRQCRRGGVLTGGFMA